MLNECRRIQHCCENSLAKVLKYQLWAYYTWKYTVASGRMWTHNRIHCIIIRLRMQLLEKLGFWGRKPLSTSHNHTNLIAMHTSFWRTRNFKVNFGLEAFLKGWIGIAFQVQVYDLGLLFSCRACKVRVSVLMPFLLNTHIHTARNKWNQPGLFYRTPWR